MSFIFIYILGDVEVECSLTDEESTSSESFITSSAAILKMYTFLDRSLVPTILTSVIFLTVILFVHTE